jgi:hypothetical protein
MSFYDFIASALQMNDPEEGPDPDTFGLTYVTDRVIGTLCIFEFFCSAQLSRQ